LDAISYHPLVTTGGKLPWAVENVFDNLVRNLEDENWNTAAQLMGALSHYTQDATMPLHATYNYNPGGNHTNYEHEVNNHLGEMVIPDYVPQELDNVFEAAMVTLEESFSFTREGSNGGVNLTDFLENNILWNDWIKSMTENRVRAAVQFTANIWYTAMIHAGLTIQAPTLTSPSDGSTTIDNTTTFTWTSVNGASSYDFQLASDNNFTVGARTVKGLSTTSYTLVEPLTNGKWYWRVRTGDNSTGVGLWSQAWCFTVLTPYVEVSISPSSQSGIPEATLIYTVTVKNNENANDNYSLENSDNSGWALSLDNNLLTIPAGENRTTTLRVTIPASAENYAVDNITITATSQENSQISASASCIARAAPGEFMLLLVAGWNLVGFPLENENATPNNLFAGTTYTMYYWEAPYGPYSEPSKNQPVQLGVGYWVKENQDTTITYSGIRSRDPGGSGKTMYFLTGWNLVCFPWTSANTTPNNLFAGTTYTMYYWEAPYGPYNEPNKNLPVEDNRGYWVKLDVDKSVTVPL
jgi:hypothetical protein